MYPCLSLQRRPSSVHWYSLPYTANVLSEEFMISQIWHDAGDIQSFGTAILSITRVSCWGFLLKTFFNPHRTAVPLTTTVSDGAQ
jgi:hypothetical protein